MPWGLTLDGSAVARDFIRRKARRKLKEIFDRLGDDNLVFALKTNRDLTSFVPPEKLAVLKGQVNREVAEHFTPDDVYSWLPPRQKALIEAFPQGKEWAYRQIELLKTILLG